MLKRRIKEICPQIKDYYLIFEDGTVYSEKSGIYLKPFETNGYLRYGLVKEDGKIQSFFGHRLVAMAFIPNNNKERTFINHIDGNKHNNHISNLEWCTGSENMQHADRTGLRKVAKGERVSSSKLREEDIPKIFEYSKNGLTQQQIGDIFGVNRSTIGYVLRGNTWKEGSSTTSRKT